MIYTLMIWTVVAMAGDRHHQGKAYDWRPIAEFQNARGTHDSDAQAKCQSAGRELGLKTENFRCIRTK